jgi:predicted permease
MMGDFRFALRGFLRRPGFAIVVVATLALGIGATVAIFTVADAVPLRPLPYRDADRLVRIGHVRTTSAAPGSTFSPQDVDDLAAAHPGLERIASWEYFPDLSGVTLTGSGEPERLTASGVSGTFFETLGVPAQVGNAFGPDDDHAGKNAVAVLSWDLWKKRFGGDPAVVGRPLLLDGKPYRVVAVMPRAFEFPSADVQVWYPLSNIGEDAVPHRREVRWLHVLGRLQPGVTPASARSGIDAVLGRLARQYASSNAGFDRALVVPLKSALTRNVRTPIWVLLGAVAVVLLIGCVNVANLLLARATTRRREIGIRAALGASRARLVRQILSESLLLSLAGGALGLLFARWAIDALAAAADGFLPGAATIGMDARVVGFALAVSIGTALIFGLLPALDTSRRSLSGALEGSGTRGGSDGRSGVHLRRALVVGEIALAAALLVGTGLLLRSFWSLTHAESGIRPDSVLALSVTLPESLFNEEKDAAYRSALLASLRALPGVSVVGASKTLPLRAGGEAYGFEVEGRPELGTVKPEGGAVIVTTGYFSALRIPILRGRDFTTADMDEARTVLLVNRTLARQLWGDGDPIGRGLMFGKYRLEVIGVAGDVREEGLERNPPPTLYVPMARFPRGTMKLFLRTAGDPSTLAEPARAAIHRFDPNLPISGVSPLTSLVADTVARPRFLTLLVSAFGAAALLLSALGVYGVISFSVARRTREIGVRIALGASRAEVWRLVLREGLTLAGIGLVLGAALAVVLSGSLRAVLFETPPQDPATLAAVGATLLGAAALACAVPARRAAALDPQEALRADA